MGLEARVNAAAGKDRVRLQHLNQQHNFWMDGRKKMSLSKRCATTLVAAMIAAVSALGVVALLTPPAAAQAQEQPAAASPAPAPAAGEPAIAKESVENPYGFQAMWQGGDFVTKGVLIILGIMSFGSWYIMITKVYEQFKLNSQARDARKSFWQAKTVKDGVAGLKDKSAFRYIAESGISASEHHEGSMVEQIDLNTWITMSVQRAMENIQNRLQDGLAFLATVGSTAPFVGLFGTVWGIYHALTAIGIAGQASIDKVAGPVGEALIMTAVGLAVAVPAVLGYNWLVRRNKVAMESVRTFGSDLHMVLLGATAATPAGKR
jgi:biopolymer transport protein ExbB